MSTPLSIFLLEEPPTALLTRVAADSTWHFLGKSDQQRAGAIGSKKRLAEFVLGRLVLKYALRCCYGSSGDTWELVAMRNIRPHLLRGPNGIAPPEISIAHSFGAIACAVAELPRLGIDIERHSHRRADIHSTARATLHPLELAEMAGMADGQRAQFFLHCWTKKEALAKALGIGMAMPFSNFRHAGNRLIDYPQDWPARHEHWNFANLLTAQNSVLGLAWATYEAEQCVRPISYPVNTDDLLQYLD